MKERLLKRMRNWEASESTIIAETDVNDLVLSLQDDLEKLFNTRLDTVLVDDAYGLPDFSDLFNGYAAPDTNEIRLAFMKIIKKFEPRLSSVRVAYNEDKKTGSDMAFIVNAKFEHKNQILPFTVNANLRDDGSIVLSK